MKHRYDRHDRVAGVRTQQIGTETGQTVQRDRTVAVQHALRFTGGAAGVAHAARLALVDVRIRERRRLPAQERFVVDASRRQPARHRAKHHDRRDPGCVFADLRNLRREHILDEENPVCGVIEDVADLLDGKANVDHVAHTADRWRREIQLVVAESVQRHRRDAITRFHARGHQRVAQLHHAWIRLAVGGPMHARNRRLGLRIDSGRDHRHDLAVGEESDRALENRRDGELIVHHRGFEHWRVSRGSRGGLAASRAQSKRLDVASARVRSQSASG